MKISDDDAKIIKDKKNIINGSFDDNIIIDYVEVEKDSILYNKLNCKYPKILK